MMEQIVLDGEVEISAQYEESLVSISTQFDSLLIKTNPGVHKLSRYKCKKLSEFLHKELHMPVQLYDRMFVVEHYRYPEEGVIAFADKSIAEQYASHAYDEDGAKVKTIYVASGLQHAREIFREAQKAYVREKAIAKLTTEEREALGL